MIGKCILNDKVGSIVSLSRHCLFQSYNPNPPRRLRILDVFTSEMRRRPSFVLDLFLTCVMKKISANPFFFVYSIYKKILPPYNSGANLLAFVHHMASE
jgi:hypothetical protein